MDIARILKRVSVSQFAALTVGFLYVSGYYINSLFVRNLGIAPTELIRLEYINIGFSFTLITLGFVLLPIGAFYLTYNVRSASNLPHFYIGLIGNSLNTALCLGFPLFLAFFLTRYEWNLALSSSVLGLKTFKSVVLAFAALAMSGMILVPFFERIVTRKANDRWRIFWYRFLVEPIRFGILGVCVYLICSSLIQIPWMKPLVQNGLYYFLAGIVFVGGITAAFLWVRYIQNIPGVWLVYALIGLGLAILFYLTVTSYVFGVYNFIPYNRGGRLPLTRAFLEVKDHDKLFTTERIVNNITLRGPAYIIEENSDSLFVASEDMDKWLTGFVPIHVVRKEHVPYIYMERIEDGFPRITPRITSNASQPTTHMFPAEFYQAHRTFQYDYIYIDAIFLALWLFWLIRNKEYKALVFGLVIAPIIYLIDAYIWWNASAGPNFPPGTFIREYWIGGVQVQHPQGALRWWKFGADFMMTISYALYAFPWLYITFRHLREGTLFSKKVIQYTAVWLSFWMLVPLLSFLLPIHDTSVQAVRHMHSQFTGWIVNLIIGYGLLCIVYRKNLGLVLRLLCIGIVGALIMEIPLYVFRIRPTGLLFIIFEGFFLLNQGVPWLFLTVDKVIPGIQKLFYRFGNKAAT